MLKADDSWDQRGNFTSEEKNTIHEQRLIPDFDYSASNEKIKKIIFSSKENIIDLLKVRPNWDEYFMILAKIAAARSTCLSRPTGAVIVKDKQVIATGYNGSMAGAKHCSEEGKCFRRASSAGETNKYDNCRSIHAEANAIAQAAKCGISVEGASIYTTLYPCYVCTKLLVSAKIKKVYYEFEYKFSDGSKDQLWEEALKEAGIELEQVAISEQAILKTMQSLITQTSLRRELKETGEPTGKIETIN